MEFGNIITAMVTPFDQQGNIDYQSTENLINHLVSNGTDALVVAGTTGESPTLTNEEQISLIRFTKKTAPGRVPVIAGTGSNNTRASIEMTQHAEANGADAIMLVTPYYSKPSQQGLYEHFKAVAASTSLPVMLYNIPGRSAVNMEPETIIQLADIPNIVSVKEASGDLDAAAKIIQETNDTFTVYSGDDSLTLPMMSIGGNGIVSVSSHIIGNEMKAMINQFKAGNVQQAAASHQQLLPVMKAMFQAPSPAPVKAALRLYGIETGDVRLPLLPLSQEETMTLKNTLYFLVRHKVS